MRALSGLVLGAVLVLAGGRAHADDKDKDAKAGEKTYVMKIATVAPEKTPWHVLLEEYKKNVEAKSNGRIKVKLYMGGTKGDENETVLKCRRGEIQAVGASTGAIASQVPELNVVEIPFLFRTFKEADDVIDNVLTPQLEPIMREYGFVLGFWSENGFRHFGTSDKFVKSPADLKGKKMRSQESAVHLEMWKDFGASPVPVPTTETLTALQNKTVDGFDQALLFMIAAAWYTSIKYVTLSSHIYQPAIIIFNKDWYDSLPADLQKVLIDEGRAIQTKGRKAVRNLNSKLVELLKEKKVEVYQLSADERAVFEKAAAPGRDVFRKTQGKRAAKLLDDVEAYLSKMRAGK
jgi:tripartite ATP-independent transporter DctP family solute receptor